VRYLEQLYSEVALSSQPDAYQLRQALVVPFVSSFDSWDNLPGRFVPNIHTDELPSYAGSTLLVAGGTGCWQIMHSSGTMEYYWGTKGLT
jgi:hypothetical protein